MAKRAIAILLSVLLVLVLFGGCSTTGGTGGTLKVGMVTDSGTIDDKSFNQGTWEGVLKAGKDFGLETLYLKPAGTTKADYLKEIGNLYDAGYKLIVCPGYKFETAIFEAQEKYKDAIFILIDGSPNDGAGNAKIGPNTTAIFFTEHESGFIAGIAAALQFKEGEFAFIGGMEIPAVQKFNWGFQQAIKYANANLGTNITIKAENVVYQGSFDNVAAGQQLAAQMFDKGIKVIFCAAGGVGVGAITEAKARAKAGTGAWIIGVDSDQYSFGIYEGEKSVILTSALKRVDQASYDMIKAAKEGTYKGGKTLMFNTTNGGVSLPAVNPNLNAEVMTKVDEVFKKIQSGEIKVSDVQGDLIK